MKYSPSLDRVRDRLRLRLREQSFFLVEVHRETPETRASQRLPNLLHGFFIPADANSVNVTPPQDTPMSNRKDGKYINFGFDVEIQKPIEKLPRGKNDNKLRRNYSRLTCVAGAGFVRANGEISWTRVRTRENVKPNHNT